MGTLRDEAYERLDYLSQLTEVVIAPQNEVLAQIPERSAVRVADIKEAMYLDWNNRGNYILSADRVLHTLYQDRHLPGILVQIAECFELQYSEDLQIDFDTRDMVGSVTLVKVIDHLEEKKLLELAVTEACRELDSYGWPRKNSRERGMTVLNILEDGCGTQLFSTDELKRHYQMANTIKNKLKDVISENKWRIRDTSVIVKMGEWIDAYMSQKSGDVGLVNLMKLKFMKDKDLPIYSIDEVQNVEPTSAT